MAEDITRMDKGILQKLIQELGFMHITEFEVKDLRSTQDKSDKDYEELKEQLRAHLSDINKSLRDIAKTCEDLDKRLVALEPTEGPVQTDFIYRDREIWREIRDRHFIY
ncbi:hypothetical protein [uncultured Cohaesibacter sp.]|uniref:hypothetical protein n=1 Tax=uncultured Cohaesibacter sp. TaxID=1002546 RepID=UPI00292D34F2|nr:hypothetical protein [uncultured Cohaesibacter sp.]